jgi:hypothetical protein
LTAPVPAQAQAHVHALDADAGESAARLCAALAPKARTRTLLLGTRQDADLCRACGLTIDTLLPRPPFAPWLGTAALGRALKGAHRVTAWSLASAAACLTTPDRPPVTLVATRRPVEAELRTPRGAAALRRLRAAAVRCVAVGDAVARALRSAGLTDVTTIPVPSVPLDTPRAAARASLGLAEGDIALALLGEPGDTLDPKRFAHIVGTARVVGHRVVGLAPARAGDAPRAARFVHAHQGLFLLLFVEGTTASMLAAADAVLWEAPGGAPLARAAINAGIPVVAGADSIGAEAATVVSASAESKSASYLAVARALVHVLTTPKGPRPPSAPDPALARFAAALAPVP